MCFKRHLIEDYRASSVTVSGVTDEFMNVEKVVFALRYNVGQDLSKKSTIILGKYFIHNHQILL